ncbi:uncharacterized protein EDB91DRAFT_1249287 [Suillus paluster]|uniref:uncharacterized protein n=1 Tax=Suillus paluster TaxID=48578 RepID=UPI001B86EC83|nr:uncharacterized protein EDB91DRAFT_1249287 [Suillus paluster]KAG1738371.1 hypothetical protein EDB91DRAFT_1249287 [Suillus paluster]
MHGGNVVLQLTLLVLHARGNLVYSALGSYNGLIHIILLVSDLVHRIDHLGRIVVPFVTLGLGFLQHSLVDLVVESLNFAVVPADELIRRVPDALISYSCPSRFAGVEVPLYWSTPASIAFCSAS